MSLILRQTKGSPLTIEEMDDNLIYLQDLAQVNNAVVSQVSIGGISAGDTVSLDSNLQDFVVQLLSKTFDPTITAPSFSLSNDQGSYREVNDTVNVGLTFTYNRGSIYGNLVLGLWDPAAFQDFRGGVASTYTLGGVPGASNTRTINNHSVTQGLNTFTGTVTYGAGPQPLDSSGNPYDSPYSAGTSPSQSTSFEGVYPIFASTSAITTATKQALVSMISGNNIEMTLVSETGGNKQFFEIPSTWIVSRPLTAVYYFNVVSNSFDPTNKISDFAVTNTTKTVQGLSVPYKKYTNSGSNRGQIKIKLVF